MQFYDLLFAVQLFYNPSFTIRHAYGYDCTKRANLHLLDEKTVVFAAGNLVQILDLQTKEQIFIRSTSGGGIGALTVCVSNNE